MYSPALKGAYKEFKINKFNHSAERISHKRNRTKVRTEKEKKNQAVTIRIQKARGATFYLLNLC